MVLRSIFYTFYLQEDWFREIKNQFFYFFMKIIFDYNRTLFDPETEQLYSGVLQLLKDLAKKHELFLISRNEKGRKRSMHARGIEKFFQKKAFVRKKTKRIFQKLVGRFSKDVIVIGDRVREEIRIGNMLGYRTIWLRRGKFSSELPLNEKEVPKHIICKIIECRKIIKLYEK